MFTLITEFQTCSLFFISNYCIFLLIIDLFILRMGLHVSHNACYDALICFIFFIFLLQYLHSVLIKL